MLQNRMGNHTQTTLQDLTNILPVDLQGGQDSTKGNLSLGKAV